MEYISAQEAATKWGISKRRVQTLCSNNRINHASRIGNMWVVPVSATKPKDARIKSKELNMQSPTKNPIREARSELKTMVLNAYSMLTGEDVPNYTAKMQIVAIYSAELLHYFCHSSSADDSTFCHKELLQIENFLFSHKCLNDNLHLDSHHMQIIAKRFRTFVRRHKYCLDDSLSWTYQYINKISLDTGLESTQFFTEKYMIANLIDNSDIKVNTYKILDPACGGGNFLLYALDYLCDISITAKTSKDDIKTIIVAALDRLYGYELDDYLAVIAYINLRLKALSILASHGMSVSIQDWNSFKPNVFYSESENICGALECLPEEHKVYKVGGHFSYTLQNVFHNTHYIFTNPPFQTVKGMDSDLKDYLKKHYPLAKCDVCNAFIEQSLMILNDHGTCGLVTQNSWMYLDSFTDFRRKLLSDYSIESIVELGSNAFYDISGEKANVALVSITRNKPSMSSSVSSIRLKNMKQSEIEHLLAPEGIAQKYLVKLPQQQLLNNAGHRLDFVITDTLKQSLECFPSYSKFATPMQGTSTGNSNELIDFFWNHFGNDEWVLVSKGGGYCRWNGLNHYCVKWGNSGEYIKSTAGSALRNVKHFTQTDLVFSDTGTSGLNVRLLRDGQIFVASGPGIRIHHGDKYAHSALLNSRLFSYYLRTISPKLTIAAGYIAKIPTAEALLESKPLSNYAFRCCQLKNGYLSKRPINIEFLPLSDAQHTISIEKQACIYFLQDIQNELDRLQFEKKIDEIIFNAYGFSDDDKLKIAKEVGVNAMLIDDSISFSTAAIDREIANLLSENCTLKRTRVSKSTLGCDGVLEYLAQQNGYNPQKLRNFILENQDAFPLTIEKYKGLYLHNLVLTLLGYSTRKAPLHKRVPLIQLEKELKNSFSNRGEDALYILNWIRETFDSHHIKAFLGVPLFYYDARNDAIILIEE